MITWLTDNQKNFLRWCRFNGKTEPIITNTQIDNTFKYGLSSNVLRGEFNTLRSRYLVEYKNRTTKR